MLLYLYVGVFFAVVCFVVVDKVIGGVFCVEGELLKRLRRVLLFGVIGELNILWVDGEFGNCKIEKIK